MKNSRKNKGFTLAEMLIVVAIVIILIGISFVGVQRHQRTMTRIEFDTIAKEIFIAAQNHLTAAEGQGYLQEENYGNTSTYTDEAKKIDDEKQGVFFVLNTDPNSDEALKIMLPKYAIDGTIAGGTYIIRYQPSTATVLDVFYSRKIRSTALTVSGIDLGTSDYKDLMDLVKENADSRQQRLNYKSGVVGYYGGGEALERGDRLAVPTFEIDNAERLIVRVTDPNADLKFASLKLVITGVKSGESDAQSTQKVIPLKVVTSEDAAVAETTHDGVKHTGDLYTVILDDITKKDLHFANLIKDDTLGNVAGLYPGEDITVKVVAYSNTRLTNIAISPEKTTNSLFADPAKAPDEGKDYTGSDVKNGVAGIANIRHLENLDPKVSNLDNTHLSINKAKQITDLSWADFMKKIEASQTATTTTTGGGSGSTGTGSGTVDTHTTKVYPFTTTITANTNVGTYYPVSRTNTDPALEYDGQNHSVAEIAVNFSANAGMFGELKNGSAVSNLKLIDFDITTTSGNAGALAGNVASTTITNVVAHNSTEYERKKSTDIDAITGTEATDIAKKTAIMQDITASAASSNAGGLIGSMTGGSVTKSAAALIVNGGANAGGLIGTASGSGTVTACYSGGHTISNRPEGAATKYLNDTNHTNLYPVRYDQLNYNVTGSAVAGGLIGDASGATITGSYSTCSAKAADETKGIAGGLVGKGGSISNSYSTGLVSGKIEGAFAGSGTTISDNGCKYFEIINERRNKDDKGNLASGYNYLKALGDKENDTSVEKIDANAEDYQSFVGTPANDWKDAKPYDEQLIEFYGTGIGVTRTARYNLKTVAQLGATVTDSDFVKDHYGDWPAPEEFIFN